MDANGVVFRAHTGHERIAPIVTQQRTRDTNRATGVLHVHHRAGILRLDLHRRVRATGRRTADQERNREPFALHLASEIRHLLQRWCDQATESDDVDILRTRHFKNLRARYHHTHVDHIVVIALQHDTDNVFSDVVHVALDGREQNFPFVLLRFRRLQQFLGFDERDQMRDRSLHHARTFHHLRQKHFAGAEQVADNVHAVHQWPLDHMDRPLDGEPRLFGVFDDEIGDTVHQRMREPLADGHFTPLQRVAGNGGGTLHVSRHLEQSFGGVRPPVEHQILDTFQQRRRNV